MPDQPNTEAVAYSDGKGNLNLHCLTCPRPPEVTIALSVNDIDHWDQCRACRRYVVDVAREAATDRSRACTWPACLTPDQHTELAAQVTAEEHGEHRPAMPDQRAACGCSEAACHCGLGTRAQCATKAWGCGPGSTDPNTEPAPAPVDPAPTTRVEEQVARHLAAKDWLEDASDDAWWNARSTKFREDYLAAARAIIALVRPAIAHELADEIRTAVGPSDVDHRFLIYNNGWYDARREAADLIDPEVTP